MGKEILKKQIEEQLDRFEKAVELPFNAELGEQMQYVRDGILNVEAYLSAPVKILYILKEANSTDNSLEDMRDNLIELNSDDPNRINALWGNTWRPIAYATYGIFEKKNWQDIPDINGNATEILKYMPNIAQINVKKYAGGATANEKEIKNFYKKYHDLLHEQIEIINPDVLVFCSTFGFFDSDYFAAKKKIQEWIPVYQFKDKLLIDTYHPNGLRGAGMTEQEYCDYIINAVNNWK
ncbi:MAG: uracil-DNA glycosylase family protein [Prevotellaceae bacterium]|jgi:hypothetical protein|nr:uracil-DNA glycosylase family protein [Prevotellaceae bacterium]